MSMYRMQTDRFISKEAWHTYCVVQLHESKPVILSYHGVTRQQNHENTHAYRLCQNVVLTNIKHLE